MILIADIILVALIIGAFQGLRLSAEEIINSIEIASQKHLIRRSLLIIGALLFVQWQMFGLFGLAKLDEASLLLFIIIVYETMGAMTLLFFREGYVRINKQIAQVFPLALKIPIAAELLFFCYLFARDILMYC